MNPNDIISNPAVLCVRKGKLVHIEGKSVEKYLSDWVASQGISENDRINLITRSTLKGLVEKATSNQIVFCRFCGKSNNQVAKLIAGHGSYICNECIDICNAIIAEDEKVEAAASSPNDARQHRDKRNPRPPQSGGAAEK